MSPMDKTRASRATDEQAATGRSQTSQQNKYRDRMGTRCWRYLRGDHCEENFPLKGLGRLVRVWRGNRKARGGMGGELGLFRLHERRPATRCSRIPSHSTNHRRHSTGKAAFHGIHTPWIPPDEQWTDV